MSQVVGLRRFVDGYVHPAAEQKRMAIKKLEEFRAQGAIAAAAVVDQSHKVPTKVTTVGLVN